MAFGLTLLSVTLVMVFRLAPMRSSSASSGLRVVRAPRPPAARTMASITSVKRATISMGVHWKRRSSSLLQSGSAAAGLHPQRVGGVRIDQTPVVDVQVDEREMRRRPVQRGLSSAHGAQDGLRILY